MPYINLPNLKILLDEETAMFDTQFITEPNRMEYKLRITTFGHHVGDNWIICQYDCLNSLWGYSLAIESKVGSTVKVKTKLDRTFEEDLPIEEWKSIVDNLLITHSLKPEYSEFSKGKAGRDFERRMENPNPRSGCMVFIIAGITTSILAFLLM